jgi:hypothetical protein
VDSLGEDGEKVDLFMSIKTCGEVDTRCSAPGEESDGSPSTAKPKKWRLVSWPQITKVQCRRVVIATGWYSDELRSKKGAEKKYLEKA